MKKSWNIYIDNAIIKALLCRKDFEIFMQQYTREEAVQRLLDSYRAYYNITLFEDEQKPLTALCEFFENAEKYVLTRKANLWMLRVKSSYIW